MRIGHFKYILKSCAMCLDIKSQQAIAYSHFTRDDEAAIEGFNGKHVMLFFIAILYNIPR